jgi:hypothetical protein
LDFILANYELCDVFLRSCPAATRKTLRHVSRLARDYVTSWCRSVRLAPSFPNVTMGETPADPLPFLAARLGSYRKSVASLVVPAACAVLQLASDPRPPVEFPHLACLTLIDAEPGHILALAVAGAMPSLCVLDISGAGSAGLRRGTSVAASRHCFRFFADLLGRAACAWPLLEELHAARVHVSDDSCASLDGDAARDSVAADSAVTLPFLRLLDMTQCGMSESLFLRLFRCTVRLPRLESLCLADNPFSEPAINSILTHPNAAHVASLDLALFGFVEEFHHAGASAAPLQEGPSDDGHASDILPFTPGCVLQEIAHRTLSTRLRTLRLALIDDAQALALLDPKALWPSLEVLDLSCRHSYLPMELDLSGLGTCAPRLRELSIRSGQPTIGGLSPLTLPRLETLVLEDTGLDEASIIALFVSEWSHLSTLALTRIPLPGDFDSWCHCHRSPADAWPSLQSVRFLHGQLHQATAVAESRWMTALPRLSSVECAPSMFMSQVRPRQIEASSAANDSGACSQAPILSSSPTSHPTCPVRPWRALTSLSLQDEHVDAALATALVQHLILPSLLHLRVDLISEAAAVVVVERGASSWPSLRHLSLHLVPLGEFPGMLAIEAISRHGDANLKALSVNPSWHHLEELVVRVRDMIVMDKCVDLLRDNFTLEHWPCLDTLVFARTDDPPISGTATMFSPEVSKFQLRGRPWSPGWLYARV